VASDQQWIRAGVYQRWPVMGEGYGKDVGTDRLRYGPAVVKFSGLEHLVPSVWAIKGWEGVG